MSVFSNIFNYFKSDEDEYYDDDERDTRDTRDNREGHEARDDGRRREIGRTINVNATAQLLVILEKPNNFHDVKSIADHLNAKKTVVLNLESTSPGDTTRILDFLGGVAYANGGNIRAVANKTFIITPYNVDFKGDELVGQLEESGLYL
jgi:cell division inhibitor SepF